MQNKTYREYLRAFHMFKTAYHMVQTYVMNKSDQSGSEAVRDEMDLVDYMISVNENLYTIMDYYENPEAVFIGFDIDKTLDHTLYKLNGARGIIGAERFLNDTGLFSKIQVTAADIMKHYIK